MAFQIPIRRLKETIGSSRGTGTPAESIVPQVQVKQVGRSHRIFFYTNLLFLICLISELFYTFYMTNLCLFLFIENHAFKKKRQLINSADLNRLLRSSIYPSHRQSTPCSLPNTWLLSRVSKLPSSGKGHNLEASIAPFHRRLQQRTHLIPF